MTIGDFAEAVALYCLMTGASETSGGRSEARNKSVGGVAHSAHRYHRGRDVQYGAKEFEFAPIDLDVARETARRLGLLLIREGDHDHLQPLSWSKG